MAIFRPVILVPGICGSSLAVRYPIVGDYTVWLSPPALLTGGMRKLYLDVPGETAPSGAGGTLIPGGPLAAYYGGLAVLAFSSGAIPTSPKADWRKPLAHDGQLLLDLMRTFVNRGQDFGVLCHSRGGLLTRWALAQLDPAEQLLCKWVVGIGVPHLGSLQAAEYIACFAQLKQRIYNLNKYFPASVTSAFGTALINIIVRSWPSLYELLPDPVRSWLPPSGAAALYSEVNWLAVGSHPYAPYLAAAVTTWAALPVPPANVPWLDVVGVGARTVDALPSLDNLATQGTYGTSLDGDGVVPVVSAHQSPRRAIYTPCSHDLLPSDGRTYGHILRFISGQLTADVTITGRFLTLG